VPYKFGEVAGILAAGYLAGGTAMVVLSKASYRSLGASQQLVDELPGGFITFLGVLKIIGAAGHIMSGAATLRIARREWRSLLGVLVLFALESFVGWGA